MGDIRISRAISGAGLSGISVTSLTFRTTDGLLNTGIAAAVMVSGIGNLPTFYINKRRYRDGVWTVECLDRCAFLDVVIDTSPGGNPWTKDSNNEYVLTAFTDALIAQCGFGTVEIPYTKAKIPSDRIDGKTFQTVLSEMATAYCGFFCCYSANALSFVQYDNSRSTDTISHYSYIHDNGEFMYSKVRVSDGTNTQEYGNGRTVLDISGEFAVTDPDDQTMTDLYSGILRSSFKGWSVDNAVSTLSTLPIVGGTLTFGSTAYRVTRVDAHIAGADLVLSVGGDIPQFGEINRRGLLRQELDDKVSTTQTYKNIKTTYQGLIAVPNA